MSYQKNDPEYHRQYYLKNREELLQRLAEPVKCECGRIITRSNISKHLKSKIHERRMTQINKEQQEKNYDLLLEKYNKLKKQLKQIYMMDQLKVIMLKP